MPLHVLVKNSLQAPGEKVEEDGQKLPLESKGKLCRQAVASYSNFLARLIQIGFNNLRLLWFARAQKIGLKGKSCNRACPKWGRIPGLNCDMGCCIFPTQERRSRTLTITDRSFIWPKL